MLTSLIFSGCLAARSCLDRLARDQRGQAMVEYSTISFFILIGFGGVSLVLFLPNFMHSMNLYLDGLYLMVDTAFP